MENGAPNRIFITDETVVKSETESMASPWKTLEGAGFMPSAGLGHWPPSFGEDSYVMDGSQGKMTEVFLCFSV